MEVRYDVGSYDDLYNMIISARNVGELDDIMRGAETVEMIDTIFINEFLMNPYYINIIKTKPINIQYYILQLALSICDPEQYSFFEDAVLLQK